MEYEISDDPQGLAERPDGDRDGGLEEDHVILNNHARDDEEEHANREGKPVPFSTANNS